MYFYSVYISVSLLISVHIYLEPKIGEVIHKVLQWLFIKVNIVSRKKCMEVLLAFIKLTFFEIKLN